MRNGAIAAMLGLGLGACSMNWNDDKQGPGVAATGSGASRSFAVTDFTGVDLRGSDDVDVRVGGAFSVRAEGPSRRTRQAAHRQGWRHARRGAQERN